MSAPPAPEVTEFLGMEKTTSDLGSTFRPGRTSEITPPKHSPGRMKNPDPGKTLRLATTDLVSAAVMSKRNPSSLTLSPDRHPRRNPQRNNARLGIDFLDGRSLQTGNSTLLCNGQSVVDDDDSIGVRGSGGHEKKRSPASAARLFSAAAGASEAATKRACACSEGCSKARERAKPKTRPIQGIRFRFSQ